MKQKPVLYASEHIQELLLEKVQPVYIIPWVQTLSLFTDTLLKFSLLLSCSALKDSLELVTKDIFFEAGRVD